jgi:hydrogenase nickel incorporation protein HypA/HybF
MHELSLATGIVETVTKHAEGRRVTAVEMRIGTLRQVVPESLAFYFGICSRDTVCEGAALEQEIIPARVRCRSCGEEWELSQPDFRCRVCAGTDVEVVSGTEFEVDSIEVTEETANDREEEGCIAPR